MPIVVNYMYSAQNIIGNTKIPETSRTSKNVGKTLNTKAERMKLIPLKNVIVNLVNCAL